MLMKIVIVIYCFNELHLIILDEQLVPLHLNFREDSPTLDNIAALLVSGLYPNVCYHKEKRKVCLE